MGAGDVRNSLGAYSPGYRATNHSIPTPFLSLALRESEGKHTANSLIKGGGVEVPPFKGATKIKVSKTSLRGINNGRNHLLSSVCKGFSGVIKTSQKILFSELGILRITGQQSKIIRIT